MTQTPNNTPRPTPAPATSAATKPATSTIWKITAATSAAVIESLAGAFFIMRGASLLHRGGLIPKRMDFRTALRLTTLAGGYTFVKTLTTEANKAIETELANSDRPSA